MESYLLVNSSVRTSTNISVSVHDRCGAGKVKIGCKQAEREWNQRHQIKVKPKFFSSENKHQIKTWGWESAERESHFVKQMEWWRVFLKKITGEIFWALSRKLVELITKFRCKQRQGIYSLYKNLDFVLHLPIHKSCESIFIQIKNIVQPCILTAMPINMLISKTLEFSPKLLWKFWVFLDTKGFHKNF